MVLLYKFFEEQEAFNTHSHAVTVGPSITRRSDFDESAKIGDIKTALNATFTIYRLELKPSAIEPFH